LLDKLISELGLKSSLMPSSQIPKCSLLALKHHHLNPINQSNLIEPFGLIELRRATD
jgi:hypothetical protein